MIVGVITADREAVISFSVRGADGQERAVLVLSADGGPLVGMATLYGHDVFLHVVDGGRVTVQTAVL